MLLYKMPDDQKGCPRAAFFNTVKAVFNTGPFIF